MPLFQRTIKLTLATCLAAALAYALGLTYAISAGVIAILSISDTRRSTIKQAYQRFMSTLLALAIGSLAFSFFWIQPLGTGSLYRSLCSLRLSIGLADRHHAKYGAGHPSLD